MYLRTKGQIHVVFGKQNLSMMKLESVKNKKEELVKIKAEQVELHTREAIGQTMQPQAAGRHSETSHLTGSKRPSGGIVIRKEPKKKKLRKTILPATSEKEDAEDRQPIGKSLKALKQASASSVPTRPRQPLRNVKTIKDLASIPETTLVELTLSAPTAINSSTVAAAIVQPDVVEAPIYSLISVIPSLTLLAILPLPPPNSPPQNQPTFPPPQLDHSPIHISSLRPQQPPRP